MHLQLHQQTANNMHVLQRDSSRLKQLPQQAQITLWPLAEMMPNLWQTYHLL
jgi:hypothetical protein